MPIYGECFPPKVMTLSQWFQDNVPSPGIARTFDGPGLYWLQRKRQGVRFEVCQKGPDDAMGKTLVDGVVGRHGVKVEVGVGEALIVSGCRVIHIDATAVASMKHKRLISYGKPQAPARKVPDLSGWQGSRLQNDVFVLHLPKRREGRCRPRANRTDGAGHNSR